MHAPTSESHVVTGDRLCLVHGDCWVSEGAADWRSGHLDRSHHCAADASGDGRLPCRLLLVRRGEGSGRACPPTRRQASCRPRGTQPRHGEHPSHRLVPKMRMEQQLGVAIQPAVSLGFLTPRVVTALRVATAIFGHTTRASTTTTPTRHGLCPSLACSLNCVCSAERRMVRLGTANGSGQNPITSLWPSLCVCQAARIIRSDTPHENVFTYVD